ncbi:unnamed protein product [Cochlearia groenlandica]
MNKDRISDLPEALLLQILSSLPTETAITTSVLSKRWRSLWKIVPNLKFQSDFHRGFDNEEEDPHVFSENVYKALISHKSPILSSLRLKFQGRTDPIDIAILISTAFAKRVRKLVLNSFYQEEQIVTLPSVLFSYNDTLEILKLKFAIDLEFPSRVSLKSLRKLCLYEVHFKDEESIRNLLSGCTKLVVRRYCNADVEKFVIAVPSLRRLTIEDLNQEGGSENGGYVINAPDLKYLNIKGFNDLDFCLVEKSGELVEARISDVCDIANENILESLTSAKRLFLHLSPLEIKVPNGKIFDKLIYLELRTHEHERMWWNLLSFMLHSSPLLQFLKLTDLYLHDDKKYPDEEKWNPRECVPECLLFNLETFAWTGYEWQRRDEKEVATYILKNARKLKKASLFTKPVAREKVEKLEKRREMLDELASVVQGASDSCHLVFESI